MPSHRTNSIGKHSTIVPRSTAISVKFFAVFGIFLITGITLPNIFLGNFFKISAIPSSNCCGVLSNRILKNSKYNSAIDVNKDLEKDCYSYWPGAESVCCIHIVK